MTSHHPCHAAFDYVRSQTIDALKLTIDEYRHRVTGASHFHLATDNDENVFLVALRTVPHDSTGVAHILEHTALCGSEKYPVRDPFFMMIRRSLNTFMNAFTSSDWTAYPFASQNRKDFNNLLDVYLDAVFFSRLDPLDFAQEGHRLEFSEPENPESPLQYKGVVFNEMKGAMSSIPSTLWHTLTKYLFPYNTYHYNSGGDPEHIPDLSYDELQAFYRSHYHPSNAVFMTFGNISAQEHQQKFQDQVLHRFQALDHQIGVPDEKRYHAPVSVCERYALSEPGGTSAKTHIVLGWLLGHNINLEENLTAQLISGILLDNSSSPLQHLLETTEYGTAPSPITGLEDSNKEMVFVCGIEGSEAEHAEAFEQQVLAVLEKIAQEGVEQERVEAVLHQLELHQREIGGDGYPYGLQLILSALPAAIHRGDPMAFLNIEPVLAKLRVAITDPNFIPGKIRELLLDNTHRVRLVMPPDGQLAAHRDAAENQRLASIQAGLSDADKEQIVAQAIALAKRQEQVDDISILPKVGLEDVPAALHVPSGELTEGTIPCHYYAQGTNGLVYQQLVTPLPCLSAEQLALLPYYSHSLTEVGIAASDYMAVQARQSSVCGGINAHYSTRNATDDVQKCQGFMVLSSKALVSNHAAMNDLMLDTYAQPRFDEHERLSDLVSQMRSRREQSITSNGHGLAMTAASSGFSANAALHHQLGGLEAIRQIKALDRNLKEDKSAVEAFAQGLKALHQTISSQQKLALLIAEAERKDELVATFERRWGLLQTGPSPSHFSLAPVHQQVRQLWQTNTQVSFCAKAYATVPMAHPDAPALTVLGGYLRNGYLHRAIREQGGAYGGGASQDSTAGSFRFYSYRDPRLLETLDDFDAAVLWLLREKQEAQQLEEAILGVVGSIDKPNSPAGEAKLAFHNQLFGRTPAIRQAFRRAILAVTLDDLRRVASTYLRPELASVAVVSSPAIIKQLPQAERQSFELLEL